MKSTQLITALAVSLVATSVAKAQCPNGTPPPCDTRAAAPLTLIKRAAPRALDDRTYIVLPFYNVTRAPDIDWLSDAAVNMLSMDLSRWQDIKVIDDRRVADYMRDMKIGGTTRLTMNDAQAVAGRAGAGRMVMGDVMKVGTRTTITATLFSARDGRQIRTAREETTVADSLIPIFGKLARQLLAVPAVDANVGSVGTKSVEAYKSYVSANQALNRFDAPAAKKHLETALTLDSNFALAHYKWAIAAAYDQKAAAERQAQLKITDMNNMARILEDPDRIAHARAAARLSASLPARDRTLINGLVAMVNYDHPRACEAYGSLVRADSTDVEALYGYALCLTQDDAVEPVVPGDTTRMRFRTSWNDALNVFRQAVSVDPTFHLAFDAIVSILTAPVRPGCVRRDAFESCADTAINRRYVARVLRQNDSIVTTPRAGFRKPIEVIVEATKNVAARENIEIASRAAAEWVALAPTEGRAHRHLALLQLRLGRSAEADRAITEALKDPAMRDDQELALRRMEVALKQGRGADVNRLIDSIPLIVGAELGRVAQAGYSVLIGRLRGQDSIFKAAMPPTVPPVVFALITQSMRLGLGLGTDTTAKLEREFFTLPRVPKECGEVPCVQVLGAAYMLGLRAAREWPVFAASLPDEPRLGPAKALAKKDTAALRAAAVRLDSISRSRLAEGRPEDASTAIAADAFLILGDTTAALRMARRLTDSTLHITGIEIYLGIGSTPATALWPRGMLLRADLEAAKGDKQVARELYTRFLSLWTRPDPEFAPVMARVRAALAKL
jgi:TolB-like protein/tetratricopeptide (TPR) repeat protein